MRSRCIPIPYSPENLVDIPCAITPLEEQLSCDKYTTMHSNARTSYAMRGVKQQIPDPALRSTQRPKRSNLRHPPKISTKTKTKTSLLTKTIIPSSPFPSHSLHSPTGKRGKEPKQSQVGHQGPDDMIKLRVRSNQKTSEFREDSVRAFENVSAP